MAILGYKNSGLFIRDFGLEEWLKTRGLPGWLEIATDNLEAPAKQRIAREIEAHYAEAVSAHLAAGEPEFSAQASTLAELGDPQEAARNFRKSHLTEDEAKSMKSMEKTAARPFFSSWMLPLDMMPFAGLVFLCVYRHWIFGVRLLAIALLMAFIGFRLIPRLLLAKSLPRTSFIKGIALSVFLTQVAFASCYALFVYMKIHDTYVSVIWGLYIVLLHNFKSNSPLRIWNKLRKMGYERNALPPHQTPAS